MGDLDSDNSGSIQSSSSGAGAPACGGDDQEYNSRAAHSMSTFFNFDHAPPLQLYNNNPTFNINMMGSSMPKQPPPPPLPTEPAGSMVPPPVQTTAGGGGVGRNPKKRSRASRRAPTTVLTTDTSNFRQMVQEFTGIPSPPFSATRSRLDLDLFRGGFGLIPRRPTAGIPPPPFSNNSNILRPFPQKIIHSSSSCSTSVQSIINNNNTNNHSNNNNSSNFQSLLQLHNPDSTTTTTTMGSYPPPPPGSSSTTSMDSLLFRVDPNPAPSSWGPTHEDPGMGHQQPNSSGVLNNNNNNGPRNFDAGSIGVVRCEGMVDSWICSSD